MSLKWITNGAFPVHLFKFLGNSTIKVYLLKLIQACRMQHGMTKHIRKLYNKTGKIRMM